MRALPLLLLVAFAGAAFWLLFAPPAAPLAPETAGEPAPAAASDQGSAPSAATAEAPQPMALGDLAPSEPAAARTVVPVTGAAPSQSLVRGRLVDRQGAPRAGVELACDLWAPAAEGLDADALMDLPSGRSTRQNEPKAKTGPDGSFAFAVAAGSRGAVVLDGSSLVLARGQGRFDTRAGDADLGDVTAFMAARIAGRVLDPFGKPLEGVTVTVSQAPFAFVTSHSDKSAADGAFAVDGLRKGQWTVATRSPQHQPTAVEVTLDDEEAREDLVIQLGRGSTIAGIVVDDRGVGVEGALVGSFRKQDMGGFVIQRFAQEEAVKSGNDGRFVLGGFADEPATIRATLAGHAAATESGVKPGSGDLVLRMSRLATVTGTLLDADGKPIAGSAIKVRPQRPARTSSVIDEGSDVALEVTLGDPLDLADAAPAAGAFDDFMGPNGPQTGPDGSFHVEGVEPGAIEVAAKGKSHLPVVRRGLQVEPGQVLSGVALVAATGAAAVVKVVDEDGQPVAGAKVTMRRPQQKGDGNVMVRSVAVSMDETNGFTVEGGQGRVGSGVTDAQGFVRIGGMPAGPVELRAEHGDYAPAIAATLNMPAQGEVEASLTLRTPGTAQLFVRDAAGNAAACDYVVRGPLGGQEPSRSRDGKSGPDGKAEVGALPAGEYEASLRLPNKGQAMGSGLLVFMASGGRPLPGTRVRFFIGRGEATQVDLRMPSLAVVRGVVSGLNGPAEGIEVELHGPPSQEALQDLVGGDMQSMDMADLPGIARQSARTDASGRYELADVPAGRYELRFGAEGQPVKDRVPVDVREGEVEVVQDLRLRTGSLRLVAVDAQGEPIEGAEVEIGAEQSEDGPQARQVVFGAAVADDSDSGSVISTMSFGGKRIRTDADGEATVDSLPPGTYVVTLSHRQYAKRSVSGQTVVENAQTDCGRVVLAPAGSVSGRVVQGDGSTATMVLVTCRRVDAAEQEAERKPALNGSFRFSGLAPGRYELRARPFQGGSDGPPTVVEVEAGARKRDVQVQAGQ